MLTHEEIKNQIVEYRQDNGLPKLSPSRLRNKAENYARQLAPQNVRDRNDPTALETLERLETGFTEMVRGARVRPHGFRAKTTSQYGNPVYAREEVPSE